jgi:hypothetical protein
LSHSIGLQLDGEATLFFGRWPNQLCRHALELKLFAALITLLSSVLQLKNCLHNICKAATKQSITDDTGLGLEVVMP